MEILLEEIGTDEICPITQMPIPESSLEFLDGEGSVLFTEHPELNAIRIKQCSHLFSALPLVYHWVRSNTMLCPMCRGGPKNAHLRQSWIPRHVRDKITRKARVEQRRDHMEMVENDAQAALLMQTSDTSTLSPNLLNQVFHWCTVQEGLDNFFVEIFEGNTPVKFIFRMDCELSRDGITFLTRFDPFETTVPMRMAFGFKDAKLRSSELLETPLPNGPELDLSARGSRTKYHAICEDGKLVGVRVKMPHDVFLMLVMVTDPEQLGLLVQWGFV